MTDHIDTTVERERLAEVRKYKLVHGEPEYRAQMCVRPDGSWVPVSIYRSGGLRLIDIIDAERAENERLREALVRMVEELGCQDRDCDICVPAHAALNGEGET